MTPCKELVEKIKSLVEKYPNVVKVRIISVGSEVTSIGVETLDRIEAILERFKDATIFASLMIHLGVLTLELYIPSMSLLVRYTVKCSEK